MLRRHLVTAWRIAERDVRTRVVGTVFGFAHFFITPFFYLAVFTWVFGSVFASRWTSGTGTYGDFALRVYAGLIVFQFFSDIIGRAPKLLLENPAYVTRIVFPLWIVVPAAVLSSLFAAMVNYSILLGAYLIMAGPLPPAVLVIPLIWGALIMFLTGLAWILSAAGVYLRDLSQFVSTALPAFMFLTPIFYPVSALSPGMRALLALNPLAWFVEATRDALIEGRMPELASLATFYAVGLLTAVLGYAMFNRVKHGFADVV